MVFQLFCWKYHVCSVLAVQNSSIGLIVPCLLALTKLTIRVFTRLQSDPRDLWPLTHLIRVMRRHDLTKKDLPTYLPTYLPTSLHKRTPFKSLFVNDIFISHVYGQRCSFTHLIYIGFMPFYIWSDRFLSLIFDTNFWPSFWPSFLTLIFYPYFWPSFWLSFWTLILDPHFWPSFSTLIFDPHFLP